MADELIPNQELHELDDLELATLEQQDAALMQLMLVQEAQPTQQLNGEQLPTLYNQLLQAAQLHQQAGGFLMSNFDPGEEINTLAASSSEVGPDMSLNAFDVADGIAVPNEGAAYSLAEVFGRDYVHTHTREPDRPKGQDRIFDEVDVGNFSVQKSEIRYPPKPDLTRSRPQVAGWRHNLVALSQKYNLYFWAATDKLHVTVPRGLKHAIPGTSDLEIHLPRTASSKKQGGYINASVPHAINHLKVGNLGNLEVLVMVCDDGDVLVYYTHLLQQDIERLTDSTRDIPAAEPFLHENVGDTAWGLAIHEKSRLIAVGSNKREVTVFFPAVADPKCRLGPVLYDAPGAFGLKANTETYPPARSAVDKIYLKRRSRSYRVTYPLDPDGHNIPAIDFSSDDNGQAQNLLVMDIKGNVWIIDIWGERPTKRVRTYDPDPDHRPPTSPAGHGQPLPDEMGWGVLCLPLSYFKQERTPHEALGSKYISDLMSQDDECGKPSGKGASFDITKTLLLVKESSKYFPTHRLAEPQAKEIAALQRETPSLVLEESTAVSSRSHKYSSGSLMYESKVSRFICTLICDDVELRSCLYGSAPSYCDSEVPPLDLATGERVRKALTKELNNPLVRAWIDAKLAKMPRFSLNIRRDMNLFTHSMAVQTQSCIFDNLDLLQLSEPFINQAIATSKDTLLPTRTAVILRTWNHDIQLIPSANHQLPSTVCRGLLKQEVPQANARIAQMDRLSLLHVIPEINLLIIGSQLGRVALITLTYVDYKFKKQCEFEVSKIPMMRVDAILPLSRDEMASRPVTTLLGMAVGPVPGNMKSWRIMLHYLEHTILSYEVSRGGSMEELIVF